MPSMIAAHGPKVDVEISIPNGPWVTVRLYKDGTCEMSGCETGPIETFAEEIMNYHETHDEWEVICSGDKEVVSLQLYGRYHLAFC